MIFKKPALARNQRKKPVWLSLLLALFCLALGASSALAAENTGITLQEYLSMVSAKHPLFEKEALAVHIEESLRRRALGARDWVLRGSGGYSHHEDITGGIAPELSRGYSTSLSMERPIWKTGGRVKAEITGDYTESEFDPALPFSPGPSKFYESRGALTYSQPLLKNRGGTLDRLEFDLAKYSVDMARLNSVENQELFILAVALKFMDWVLLSEKREIARRRLALANDQLRQVKKKRKANLVDEVDKLRAVDSKEIARANLLLAEAAWKALQAELAIFAGSDGLYKKKPAFDIYATGLPEHLNIDDTKLLLGSRVLGALTSRIEQLERERNALLSTKKPELSLDASVAVKGGADTLTSSVGSDGTDATLSMNFAYPLGNRSASAGVERIELLIRQTKLERDKVLLDQYAAIKGLTIQIEEYEKVLQINSAQIKSARARTKEEMKLYNQGRGELTFVIQSQDSEEGAMLNYANNAAHYHRLVLELRALTDDLLTDGAVKKIMERRASQ